MAPPWARWAGTARRGINKSDGAVNVALLKKESDKEPWRWSGRDHKRPEAAQASCGR
jgi:hypothetical protein